MDWRALEGQRLDGHFDLKRLIGRGGFGAVFDADHLVDGKWLRRVAVKVVTRDPLDDRQVEELIAAANLHHDFLVRTFTAGQTTIPFGSKSIPLLYLVMELAGMSLKLRLRQGTLGPMELMAVAESTADALKHLHGIHKGLIHRDIKPANILLFKQGWKVADFGLSRLLTGTLDETSRVAGTPAYMSPESFRGVISPAWDIWSLGVTLAECSSGGLPFTGDTTDDIRRAVENDEPDLPTALAPRLREIVTACLHKNPSQRPTASDLLDMLRPHRRPTLPKPVVVAQDASGDYRTIGDALTGLRDSESPRVIIRSGVYNETLTLDRSYELTAEGQVTIRASGSTVLKCVAGDSLVRGLVIEVVEGTHGAPAIEITGGRPSFKECTIRGKARTGVRISAARSHPSFSDCQIAGEFEAGISIRESADALIDRCSISGTARAGLEIGDRAHPVVRYTTVQGGSRRGVLVTQGGLGIMDQCDISANGETGVELAKNSDVVLVGCRIDANGGYGIRAGSGAKGTVKNCTIQGNRQGPWLLEPGHQLKREGNRDERDA